MCKACKTALPKAIVVNRPMGHLGQEQQDHTACSSGPCTEGKTRELNQDALVGLSEAARQVHLTTSILQTPDSTLLKQVIRNALRHYLIEEPLLTKGAYQAAEHSATWHQARQHILEFLDTLFSEGLSREEEGWGQAILIYQLLDRERVKAEHRRSLTLMRSLRRKSSSTEEGRGRWPGRELRLASQLLKGWNQQAVQLHPPQSLPLPIFLEQLMTKSQEMMAEPATHPAELTAAAHQLSDSFEFLNRRLRFVLEQSETLSLGNDADLLQLWQQLSHHEELEGLFSHLVRDFKVFCHLFLQNRMNELAGTATSSSRRVTADVAR